MLLSLSFYEARWKKERLKGLGGWDSMVMKKNEPNSLIDCRGLGGFLELKDPNNIQLH